MDKIIKLLKELINVSLINEADIRTLRRVVILAIFNSDIPNQMEKDFKRRISSNPDPGVIKSNKKFLEQLLEDKEALVNDEKYLELKQDQKFQELSNSVNNKLTSLNKANDINFGNIAFTKPQLSKKFSYSTLLYYSAEGEVKNLENYLSRTYGSKFVFDLLRTKEMGPGSPETAQSGMSDTMNELTQAKLLQIANPDYHASEEFDKSYGTKLSKVYKLPLDVGIIKKTLDQAIYDKSLFNKDNYENDIDSLYNGIIRSNSNLRVKVNNIEDKWNVIYGVLSHLNPDDIKYFVENPSNLYKDENEKEIPVENAYEKYDVAIGWMPSPKSWEVIKNILTTKYPDIQWPLTDIN